MPKANIPETGKSTSLGPSAVHLPGLIEPPTVEGLAKYIVEKNCRRILIMLGAGISVAAGIPDFRTPGTGLYSKLGKYKLEQPEEVFSIKLLKEKPEVFYTVANDMQLWPGLFAPTHVHHFVKLLCDEGRVMRVCTQNIDTLERQAGVDDATIVEAHGSFASAHCIAENCREPFPMAKLRAIAEAGQVPRCEKCGSVAKPDVVFFGESLPSSFRVVRDDNAPKADLLLVIGTSLKVHPFASLASYVPKNVPRVLINNERAGGAEFRFEQDIVEEGVRKQQREERRKAKLAAKAAAPPKCESGSAVPDQSSSDDSEDGNAMDMFAVVRALNRSLAGQPPEPECTEVRDFFLQGDCQTIVKELASSLGLAKRLAEAHRIGASQCAARRSGK